VGATSRAAHSGGDEPDDSASLAYQISAVLKLWARGKLDRCLGNVRLNGASDTLPGQSGGGGGHKGGGGGGPPVSVGGSGGGETVGRIHTLVGRGDFEQALALSAGDEELVQWVRAARQASDTVQQCSNNNFLPNKHPSVREHGLLLKVSCAPK